MFFPEVSLLKEQSRQLLILILIALVFCAVIVGYNAFYVPEAPLSEPAVTTDARQSSTIPAVSSYLHDGEKLNLNTATAQQMADTLPGIGDKTAASIVAYREKHGLFHSVEEIKNVKGIGDKKFSRIENLLTVG